MADNASLAYELRSDGVLYDLDCGVKVRLRGKSAARVSVTMQRGNAFIPPETGDLGTSRFRDRLAAKAGEHFGEVNGFAGELGLIAVAYPDHLTERERAADQTIAGENEAPELMGTPYRVAGGGFVRLKRTQEGEIPKRLTNFTAKITADVAEDDGAEVRRSFEIEARLANAGRLETFTIPSSQFAPMGWVTEHLGASAIIYPGSVVKDHARAAVQMLSGEVESRHVYAHTSWREVDGAWVYLQAGGGIGQVGQVSEEGGEGEPGSVSTRITSKAPEAMRRAQSAPGLAVKNYAQNPTGGTLEYLTKAVVRYLDLPDENWRAYTEQVRELAEDSNNHPIDCPCEECA